MLNIASTIHLSFTEKTAKVYFSSNSPQHLRLFLIDAPATKTVRLAIYYKLSQRLDVYCKETTYIKPTNAAVSSTGDAILQTPSTNGQFLPPLDGNCGSNWFDWGHQLQYVILRGSDPVDIKVSEAIIVSLELPAMTVDEFFGKNIVRNLAAFLGISPSKIKCVDIVSASGNRRKKRSPTFRVKLMISDHVNDGQPPMTRYQLEKLSTTVMTAMQTRRLSAVLNIDIIKMTITNPIPAVGSPEWQALNNGSTVVAPKTPVQVPKSLTYGHVYKYILEGVKISPAPVVVLKDDNVSSMSPGGGS